MSGPGRAGRRSTWIDSGADPVEVAHRAGHSLAVLLRFYAFYAFYAKILKGRQPRANELVGKGLSGGQVP
ncbi:hypothetical protein [Streptomyces sp. NPDC051567]|uniref:hypothetical protein n=1 Tax=Streptomyces sp. NPDC051567 TaxID=3365660 RepID=UPI0037B51137